MKTIKTLKKEQEDFDGILDKASIEKMYDILSLNLK